MSATTLRERKKKKTREALSQAALELFLKQGYETTTVEQIAESVEISRRTFFRYYATKEEVVFPHRDTRLSAFRTMLEEPMEGETGFGCVSRACLALAAEYMEHREELYMQHRVVDSSSSLWAFEMRMDRAWEEAMAQALETNPTAPLPHFQAVILAGAVMGAIRATLREWFANKAKDDLVEMGQQALQQVARAWEQ